VETEKGIIEIEVFADRVMDRLLVQPGEQVPVGTYWPCCIRLPSRWRRQWPQRLPRGCNRLLSYPRCRSSAIRGHAGETRACLTVAPWIREALGVDIPEADYGQLTTLTQMMPYLAACVA
jgi:hypothetical protein